MTDSPASPNATATPDRPDVFISYSRTDQEFVETRLHVALVARDKECWVDLEDIRPAADWLEAIYAGIDAALCFAVVIGQPWLDSEVCRQEFDRALASNKRLIPILRHDVDIATLPESLRRANWIMMRDTDDFDVQFKRLIEAMETDLAWIERHARLTVRTREWEQGGRDRGALLRGRDLADAEEWLATQGSHGETPTALQGEFIVASRRARGRASRIRLVAVTAALVVSVGLGVLALLQRNQAESRTIDANSLALAGSSAEPLATRPDISLAMAFEAYRLRQRPETISATRRALLAARRSGLRGVLPGDGKRLLDIAISPDAKIMAAGGDGGRVLLWNAVSRERIGRLSGPGSAIAALAFSPDGKLLAAGRDDGTVSVWNTGTRARLTTRGGGVGAVYGLAFSPSGKTLAVSGYDGVSLGSVTGSKRVVLAGDDATSFDVAFSRDGRALASGGTDGLTLWDPSRPSVPGRLLDDSGRVNGVGFSSDGRAVAAAREDGAISIWNATDNTAIGSPRPAGGGPLEDVAFGTDDKIVASAGDDGAVRLWNVGDGRPLGALRGHIGAVSSVAFSMNGRLLASAGDVDATVHLWNPDTRTGRGVFEPGEGAFRDVGYSSDGTTLASVGLGVSLLNPATSARRHVLAHGDQRIYDIAFKRGGQVLGLAREHDASIRLWDAAKRRPIGRLRSRAEGYRRVAYSRDGQTVAAADSRRSVQLWKLPATASTGHIRFPDEVNDIAFSPDARTLAVAGADDSAGLYDLTTGERRASLTGHTNFIEGIAYSPDGEMIATASDDVTVRLWRATTGKALGTLTGHTRAVNAVAFSPDGRILASASADNTIRLWDPVKRTSLGRLEGHSAAVTSVAFSPDGRTIASASDDGSVRLWSEILWRGIGELHATVCDALLTGISRSDWKQYAGDIPYRRSCR